MHNSGSHSAADRLSAARLLHRAWCAAFDKEQNEGSASPVMHAVYNGSHFATTNSPFVLHISVLSSHIFPSSTPVVVHVSLASQLHFLFFFLEVEKVKVWRTKDLTSISVFNLNFQKFFTPSKTFEYGSKTWELSIINEKKKQFTDLFHLVFEILQPFQKLVPSVFLFLIF